MKTFSLGDWESGLSRSIGEILDWSHAGSVEKQSHSSSGLKMPNSEAEPENWAVPLNAVGT